MELNIKKANELFKRISEELSPKFKGKIVAIDADSGSYFIGDSELDAYKKAIEKYPNKKFIFKRTSFYINLIKFFCQINICTIKFLKS
mgnify:CR=1 FL=1